MRLKRKPAVFEEIERGLGRYTTGTPIGYIDALRFQSSSIGLQVLTQRLPDVASHSETLFLNERGLEPYRFGTPFGHILLSVESVSKGLQVLTQRLPDVASPAQLKTKPAELVKFLCCAGERT